MSPVTADVRLAIDKQNRLFESHFAARDAQALVTAYFVPDSDSPTASPPGGTPPLQGRAVLIQMFQGQFEAVRSIRLESVRLESSGDLAFELGRAHLTLQSGEAALGRFCVLWKRVGSEWRAAVDFFDTDGWQD